MPITCKAANGISDSCKGGIDRLGYDYYSQAIFEVVSNSEPSLCVGLYARYLCILKIISTMTLHSQFVRWGSGKSFLIELIKRKFDPKVREQKGSFELLQSFDDGYDAAEKNEPALKNITSSTSISQMIFVSFFEDNNVLF